MEKIKWAEKVTNEEVLERIEEKKTLLNNNLRRKAIWIGHILRRNCLLPWSNQETDFMKSRNMEEDMAEDTHLWRLYNYNCV